MGDLFKNPTAHLWFVGIGLGIVTCLNWVGLLDHTLAQTITAVLTGQGLFAASKTGSNN